MPSRNNPAGRLYLILDEFRKIADQTAMHHAWAQVLDIPKDDVPEVLAGRAQVLGLVEETKKSLLQQDVDHSLYLRPFAKIQQVFMLAFGHQVKNAKEHLTNDVMARLEFCDELLSRTVPEEIIDEETLNKLQQRVEELIEEVGDSDLPQDVKNLILENLNAIRNAILNYRIHGAEGLKDVLEKAVGSMVIHHPRMENVSETEEGEKMIAKYRTLVKDYLSIAVNAIKIGQFLGPHLAGLLEAVN